ncbi:MAG: type II secretion system protein [Candidatus Omnitrophica bacterium]|nr:type II secretion system protein [Candidatus Omnitrophota bacterium]
MRMLRSKKGMTFIEILVALLIFTLALGPLLNSLLAGLYLIQLTKEQTIAISDLRNMLEDIRATALANMFYIFPESLVDGPVSNSYQSVVGGYALMNEHITVTYVNVRPDLLEIKVNLTWKDRRSNNQNASIYTFKTR